MVNEVQGALSAEGFKIAVVAGRFNDFLVKGLISGALDCLERHGADMDNVTVFRVPGAFEIPAVSKRITDAGGFDAVVCLGAVIRGNTPHFEYVSSEVIKGIANLSMETDIPVGFGVITTDNIEQAIERAGSKSGNKGWEAALSVLEMLDLYRKIGG